VAQQVTPGVINMKNKISKGSLALGVLCIICGIDFYSSEWSFKYQQPISKIGSISLVIFGIVLLIIELIKLLKFKNLKMER